MKQTHIGSKLPTDLNKKPSNVYSKTNNAHLGALLTQKKSYSTLRLIKDQDELDRQPLPLLGVSASPINDSMYKWHANVKCIADDSPYKGAILHFELLFSEYYPKIPPKIKVLNK